MWEIFVVSKQIYRKRVADEVELLFFYNVFRATRYKTTSLPAALNQARRIDTVLWICIVMHFITRSRIYWRPSLCMYYAIDEDKSWIQIKLQASCRHFLYHIMKYYIRKYTKIHVCQYSILSCNGRYRWCLYLSNLQYSLPDTLLCYITIQYFIFFWFFDFCTIRKQNIGGAHVMGARICRGEWDVWMKWA